MKEWLERKIGLKKMSVANYMTLGRFVCIPIFVLFYALHWYAAALGIFVLAAFTDIIDGTVARMLKEKSDLGALLDPAADKALMLTVFIALARSGIVPLWFICIILARDAVVIYGLIYVKVKKINFEYRAIWSSKIATFFEIVAAVFALTAVVSPKASIGVFPVAEIALGMIYITAILVLIATMQYLKIGLETLESIKER